MVVYFFAVKEAKMRRILYLIFVVTIIIFVDSELRLCRSSEPVDFSEKEQRVLFERFNIPKSLFCENIALELYCMSWYVDLARKDNWQEATRHPTLYKEGRDLNKYELNYFFGTIENKRKFIFNVSTIAYEVNAYSNSDDEYKYEDHVLEGQLLFHDNGNPKEFNHFLSIYKFSEDNKSGLMYFTLPTFQDTTNEEENVPLRSGYVEWKNGKTSFDETTKDERTLHKYYQQSLKDFPFNDLKLSILNKKPIKPITLDAENDYAIKIPKYIDPDTRKVLVKIVNAYKTLKDGQVKKLLTDNYYKQPGEFSVGVVRFRFGKNYLYDVAASDTSSYPTGVYMMFDDKSHVKLWLSGDFRNIDPDDERKITNPPKVRYSIDGNGVEIHFHSTGFPKSYRTIIKNRLFGRQIEWDEIGKVISNVDLDFPQKWNEAPPPRKD
jgi:hypothetical protein